MLKEDVSFAKEQFKIAEANYCRLKQQQHDQKKHILRLEQEMAKTKHELNKAKESASSFAIVVADAKADFQNKLAHWRALNSQYQFLCNQNNIIEGAKNGKK